SQYVCSNNLDSEIFITVCCRSLNWGKFMPMNTNRTSRRSAYRARPASIPGEKPICASRSRGVRAGSVASAVAGILGAAGFAVPAHAQTAAAAAPAAGQNNGSAQTSQNLQEVVVTATATQLRKLDASYNVVAADNELIKESNPLSAADVLKIAPGIWPEASG